MTSETKKFTGLRVVPSIGVNQQVDAGVMVSPDQVDGLEHRTDKPSFWAGDDFNPRHRTVPNTSANTITGTGAYQPDTPLLGKAALTGPLPNTRYGNFVTVRLVECERE
jgi:hypothetical protein